jgi:hypothetical protein
MFELEVLYYVFNVKWPNSNRPAYIVSTLEVPLVVPTLIALVIHVLSILCDLNHAHGDQNLHDVISCYHDFTYVYLRALQHKPHIRVHMSSSNGGSTNPSWATGVAQFRNT